MRVSTRRRGDERGAVLVIVAAFSIVAVIFLAFVIDLGNQRQNRRQLTTETDAVALSAAKDWAFASLDGTWNDCSDATSVARLSVSNNPTKNPAADPTCAFSSPNPFQGYVTATDQEIANFVFDGVTGVNEGNTGSTSTVAISVVDGGGLRPLGLCLLDDTLQQWLLTGTPTQFDIYAPRFLDPACVGGGGSPGNWSQVVLPPSSPNQNDWVDDVENGAGEDVVVNQVLENLTGVGMNSAQDEFETLIGTTFFLPVYSVADTSNGSHVEYPVTGFLEIRLISFDLSGRDPSFLIEPLRFQTSGTCCFANGYNVRFAICDVGTIGGTPSGSLSDDCLAPLPPDVTTTTQPDPCLVTAITPASQTVTLGSGNKLDSDVSYTLRVANRSDCAGLAVSADRGPGQSVGAVLELGVNADELIAVFEQGTSLNSGRTYDIKALDGPVLANATVPAQLVTT